MEKATEGSRVSSGRPLIVVESPAKAETIKKYLKGQYDVLASKGHVKDLPENRMGVDIARGFRPQMVLVPGRRKIVEALKKAARGASKILLACDPDREGEAIAWHIAEELRPINANISRVLFHEITANGLRVGLENPRPLDEKMFESQLARRILDRLVGYHLSPLLWRKVQSGLSAGRVQSPALRLIVEREREIEAFVPREYWLIFAFLRADEEGHVFRATLRTLRGEKAEIRNGSEADAIIERLKNEIFRVESIEKKERRRPAPPPFITSTLQQEASRLLRLPPSRTMRIAQTLYEGVDLGEEGRTGLITYMRTDSVRVSAEAIAEARAEIARRFGPLYVPERPNSHKQKAGAQDAHEAIRPTSVARRPEDVRQYLKPEEFALYQIIYQRFLASQMVAAIYDQTVIDVAAGDAVFRASGSVLRMDGFLAAWTSPENRKESEEEDSDADQEGGEAQMEIPPDLAEGQLLALVELKGEQKFTQPPPRYTEASLIRELEERGIGRPSTYATIVSTIQEKGYCEKKKGRLRPTELGRLVNDLLTAHFQDVVDYEFTARMEEALDAISEGKMGRVEVLQNFWKDFEASLKKAAQEMQPAWAVAQPSGVTCDVCGREMLIRYGRNGPFLGCSGYPECKNTREFDRDDDGHVVVKEQEKPRTCPQCGAFLHVRTGRFGKFWACSAYPKCKYTEPYSLEYKCPQEKCDGHLVEKKGRGGRTFYSCSRFPACKFITSAEPTAGPCPKCGAPTLFRRKVRGGVWVLCLRDGCGQKQVYGLPRKVKRTKRKATA